MDDLRKCPFCGCAARVEMIGTTIENGEEYDDYTVECTNKECLCFLGVGLFRSKEAAIEAWNRRVCDDDCVSRQAAIDEVEKNEIKSCLNCEYTDALKLDTGETLYTCTCDEVLSYMLDEGYCKYYKPKE